MKKIVLFILTFILLSSVSLSVSATYYEDSYPSNKTGLTGGLFIECSTNIGDAVIIIPYNYKNDTFTFSTSGNVFNLTSGTVSGYMYVGNNTYSVRWSSFSYPQYRQTDNSYSYTDLTIRSVSDTNVVFLTDDIEKSNDNYYLSTFEKIIISLLCALLFFQFLNWFLLHRVGG